MAQDAKFTHISVTSDEDDDFVIEAGAARTAPACEQDPRPVRAEASAAGDGEKPASAAEPAKPAKAAGSAEKADAYRPTTLDDLNGTKMPLAQKIVVVLAVLAIVAFAVWYVTAH